jgi:hypothetical protein
MKQHPVVALLATKLLEASQPRYDDDHLAARVSLADYAREMLEASHEVPSMQAALLGSINGLEQQTRRLPAITRLITETVRRLRQSRRRAFAVMQDTLHLLQQNNTHLRTTVQHLTDLANSLNNAYGRLQLATVTSDPPTTTVITPPAPRKRPAMTAGAESKHARLQPASAEAHALACAAQALGYSKLKASSAACARELKATKLALTQAKAELKSAKGELTEAKASSAPCARELKATKLALTQAKAELKSAKGELTEAKASVTVCEEENKQLTNDVVARMLEIQGLETLHKGLETCHEAEESFLATHTSGQGFVRWLGDAPCLRDFQNQVNRTHLAATSDLKFPFVETLRLNELTLELLGKHLAQEFTRHTVNSNALPILSFVEPPNLVKMDVEFVDLLRRVAGKPTFRDAWNALDIWLDRETAASNMMKDNALEPQDAQASLVLSQRGALTPSHKDPKGTLLACGRGVKFIIVTEPLGEAPTRWIVRLSPGRSVYIPRGWQHAVYTATAYAGVGSYHEPTTGLKDALATIFQSTDTMMISDAVRELSPHLGHFGFTELRATVKGDHATLDPITDHNPLDRMPANLMVTVLLLASGISSHYVLLTEAEQEHPVSLCKGADGLWRGTVKHGGVSYDVNDFGMYPWGAGHTTAAKYMERVWEAVLPDAPKKNECNRCAILTAFLGASRLLGWDISARALGLLGCQPKC